MATTYYGTLAEADTYFGDRLHSEPWLDASSIDQPKALNQARIQIDNLNFKGVKKTVYAVMYNEDGTFITPGPSRTTIITAGNTQALEFPRGSDTSVPEQIKQAQWEIALLLLDGADLDVEYDALRVKQQSYSLVRTTYADDVPSVEHIGYGILSPTAWRLLKPFLLMDGSIRFSRVD